MVLSCSHGRSRIHDVDLGSALAAEQCSSDHEADENLDDGKEEFASYKGGKKKLAKKINTTEYIEVVTASQCREASSKCSPQLGAI